MRLTPGGDSPDLEDRRGQTGGGGRFRMPGGRLGLGGLAVLLVLSLVFKQNFFALLGGGDASGPDVATGPVQASAEEEQLKTFIGTVLDDVQATWDGVLPEQTGTAY
ncbi:MAG TPA: neutral zinc metallopeptidase, partial [Gemmatimonadales bacterium]|nr:neutral zinc metallopeptidase [Gemmatimonadales bacterium]